MYLDEAKLCSVDKTHDPLSGQNPLFRFEKFNFQ